MEVIHSPDSFPLGKGSFWKNMRTKGCHCAAEPWACHLGYLHPVLKYEAWVTDISTSHLASCCCHPAMAQVVAILSLLWQTQMEFWSKLLQAFEKWTSRPKIFSMCCFFFFLKDWFIYLKGRLRDLPCTDIFPKWLQQPGPGPGRNWEPGTACHSHAGIRDPSSWAISHHLPRHISRELDWVGQAGLRLLWQNGMLMIQEELWHAAPPCLPLLCLSYKGTATSTTPDQRMITGCKI